MVRISSMSERIEVLLTYKKLLWQLFGYVGCNVPASKFFIRDKVILGRNIYDVITKEESILEDVIKLKQKTEYEKSIIRFVIILEIFLVKNAYLLIGGFYD
tara:strand:+ start:33 stop:335 length:303 start_codon:yes stop_codon:yes gene_type:complete